MNNKNILLILAAIILLLPNPADARRVLVAPLNHPIKRLSVDEARVIISENLIAIRNALPNFTAIAKESLQAYQRGGLNLLKQTCLGRLQGEAKTIEQYRQNIKAATRQLGFESEEMQRDINNLLASIMEATGAGKIIGRWDIPKLASYGLSYGLGLSEEEYIDFLTLDLQVTSTDKLEVFDVVYDREHDWMRSFRFDLFRAEGFFTPEDEQAVHSILTVHTPTIGSIYNIIARTSLFLRQLNQVNHNGGLEIINFVITKKIQEEIPEIISEIKAQGSSENLIYLEGWLSDMSSYEDDYLDLIETAIDYIRIGVAPKITNVTETLNQQILSYESRAESKGLTFDVNITDSDIILLCDLNQLIFAVDNIIQNAIKYTVSGSVSVITTIEKGPLERGRNDVYYLKFIVEDTGIGVPDEELIYIQDRGYRATNTEDIMGTGVGLDIVRSIVLASMLGEFTIESKLGEGTTVTIKIPIEITPQDEE